MLKIVKFTCENSEKNCVTDRKKPRFSFALQSDKNNTSLKKAVLAVNGWEKETDCQIAIPYEGTPLKSFSAYDATLRVTDNHGETAEAVITFETGRLDEKWIGNWITDPQYFFKEKRISPIPMVFRKTIEICKKVKCAKIYITAMGIYELSVNGQKIGEDYFAPGFTSYENNLQYQCYDFTSSLHKENELFVTVAGGWAVGSFLFKRKNRINAKRQALLAEIHLTYQDGSKEIIPTDETWQVTQQGPYREADFYDGERYDATIDLTQILWRNAGKERLKINPQIIATYGDMVRAHEIMEPIFLKEGKDGELIYDFGQNFAGVIRLTINGKRNQVITVRHAEILKRDGSLNTELLRSAKATVTYICKGGKEVYSPRFTYMGFRYISVKGIEKENFTVDAIALYSDIKTTGSFSCSNEMINRLQENIVWSAKSNFMDIPTDCPQRDERLGWTGDIAVFAETACYDFDVTRFLEKWLKDVKSEQSVFGGIPVTVPKQKNGFPIVMPSFVPVDFWGDACLMVPWAMYQARGDKTILEEMYPVMKKYVDACRFWASLFSRGEKKYIWDNLPSLHFGDWVAPDLPKMKDWQARSKWTATVSLKHTSKLLSEIAGILGKSNDEETYGKYSEYVKKAFLDIFTDGKGKMNEEFQTGYVLPLYFGIFEGDQKAEAAKNLDRLVRENNYCIGTGFPGTPYILFALADNGYADTAFKMLENTQAPSWLYEVKSGATTIWERWDGLDENGECPIQDDGIDVGMVSYNHYASGAVGKFLYSRIVGIENLEPGYQKVSIKPLLGSSISAARGSFETPYGTLSVSWEKIEKIFSMTIEVPVGTVAEVVTPGGENRTFGSGTYQIEESLY